MQTYNVECVIWGVPYLLSASYRGTNLREGNNMGYYIKMVGTLNNHSLKFPPIFGQGFLEFHVLETLVASAKTSPVWSRHASSVRWISLLVVRCFNLNYACVILNGLLNLLCNNTLWISTCIAITYKAASGLTTNYSLCYSL